MGTRTSADELRRRAGEIVTYAIGATFVLGGVRTGDVGAVVTGVAFVAAMRLVAGPLLRWQRRGDGPHATQGVDDDRRLAYLRIRYPGDHQGG